MLGIGFLALVGVGLAITAGGGGDDDDLFEDINDPEQEEPSLDAPNIPLTPEDALSAQDAARIEEFKQDLQDQPDLSNEERAQRLNEFITQLLAERDAQPPLPTTPIIEPPIEEEPPVAEGPSVPGAPEEIVRPPFGEGLIDPLDNPRPVFVPSVPEEDGPAPSLPIGSGATAQELVNVTRPGGDSFDDDRVIETGPSTGEDADRDFIVESGLERNDIAVDYDSETTFLIKYTNSTGSVTASLNSDIEGPRGAVGTSISAEVDDNGTEFDLLTSTRTFADSARIELNVTQEQIGEHVSQIDLQNPNDSLFFNFGADVTGNLHLVYNDAEQDSLDDMLTARTLYVIETSAAITSLTPLEIARLIADDGSAVLDTQLIAEVNLGFESLRTTGDPASLQPYTVTVADFINSSPQVNSNVDWASITEFDSAPT